MKPNLSAFASSFASKNVPEMSMADLIARSVGMSQPTINTSRTTDSRPTQAFDQFRFAGGCRDEAPHLHVHAPTSRPSSSYALEAEMEKKLTALLNGTQFPPLPNGVDHNQAAPRSPLSSSLLRAAVSPKMAFPSSLNIQKSQAKENEGESSALQVASSPTALEALNEKLMQEVKNKDNELAIVRMQKQVAEFQDSVIARYKKEIEQLQSELHNAKTNVYGCHQQLSSTQISDMPKQVVPQQKSLQPYLPNHSLDDSVQCNQGRWSEEEHRLFLDALKMYGKNWEKIKQHIKTRDAAHCRSHAQKFIIKLKKSIKGGADAQHIENDTLYWEILTKKIEKPNRKYRFLEHFDKMWNEQLEDEHQQQQPEPLSDDEKELDEEDSYEYEPGAVIFQVEKDPEALAKKHLRELQLLQAEVCTAEQSKDMAKSAIAPSGQQIILNPANVQESSTEVVEVSDHTPGFDFILKGLQLAGATIHKHPAKVVCTLVDGGSPQEEHVQSMDNTNCDTSIHQADPSGTNVAFMEPKQLPARRAQPQIQSSPVLGGRAPAISTPVSPSVNNLASLISQQRNKTNVLKQILSSQAGLGSAGPTRGFINQSATQLQENVEGVNKREKKWLAKEQKISYPTPAFLPEVKSSNQLFDQIYGHLKFSSRLQQQPY